MANPLDKLNKIPVVFKVIALVVVLIVMVLGFWFTSWTTLDEQAESLRAEKRNLERQYEEQKAVADDLPNFIENTKRLEEDLDIALKQLPREKEIPSLLRDIYTLGRKSGIEFKTFEPQNVRNQNLYAELPIRLQIEGTYHEVGVFFDRIGKMNRIVNISNLEANLSSQDGEDRLSVNCIATTFMFTGSRG